MPDRRRATDVNVPDGIGRRRPSRAAARLVRAAVQTDAAREPLPQLARLFAEVDPQELIDLAALHRISGYLLALARVNDAAPSLVRALDLTSRRTVGLHLRVLGELRLLETVLVDVPWLVVKGPVLAGRA
jgi:hypothetical protein